MIFNPASFSCFFVLMPVSLNVIATGLRPSGTTNGKMRPSIWSLPQAVLQGGFTIPLSCILYVWDLEAVSFFNPLTLILQMSGLFLSHFLLYRSANPLLSSSPSCNNSLAKAANTNQNTLQIAYFLDSSSRASNLGDFMTTKLPQMTVLSCFTTIYYGFYLSSH